MKRVNINVDLNENEAFDKEVQKIIRDKVREMARNENKTIIQEAASEEFKRIFDANAYGYRDKLNKIVKECATTSIKEVLEELDIPKITKEKAAEIMDAKIDYYLQNTEEKCKIAFDAIVTKKAEERIQRILR